MKATKQQIEKENSYPHKIIIERKCEGLSLSDCMWDVSIVMAGDWKIGKMGFGKYTKGVTVRGWVNDKNMEKVLKVLGKLKEYY